MAKYGGSWRAAYLKRAQTDSSMLRGKPSDYEMIACRGHKAHITALAFNGDLIVSGSNDGTIIFWTPENEEEYKKHIFEVHTSPVTKIEIDIDERRVVTLSDDCAIGIWNIQNLPNEIAHERTLTTDMNR